MLPAGRAAAPAAEVQINLCTTPEAAAKALHLEPADAERYEVWYFETADQALFRSGVTVRLRIKAHSAELTLKFADQDCARIDPARLPARQSKCEYDVRGAVVAGAVSISRRLDDDQLRALRARPGDLSSVLSPAQIGYLRDPASVWPLPAPLKLLGPARVQPYRHKGDGFAVEAWQFPAGLRLLEISQKTRLADAQELDASLRALLARHPVAICADQGSPAGAKLRALLER
jgi:hypothetical protein